MNQNRLAYLRDLKQRYDEDGIYSETPQAVMDKIMADLEELKFDERQLFTCQTCGTIKVGIDTPCAEWGCSSEANQEAK